MPNVLRMSNRGRFRSNVNITEETNAQAIANATTTPLVFGTAAISPDTIVGNPAYSPYADIVVDQVNDRFTLPRPGLYMMHVTVIWAAMAGGDQTVGIRRDDSAFAAPALVRNATVDDQLDAVAEVHTQHYDICVDFVAPNLTCDIIVAQTSGGAINVTSWTAYVLEM